MRLPDDSKKFADADDCTRINPPALPTCLPAIDTPGIDVDESELDVPPDCFTVAESTIGAEETGAAGTS